MPRGSFHSRRSERASRRKIAIATILALFLLSLDLVSGGKLRALARAAMTPLWKLGGGAYGAVVHGGYFETRGALEAQIQSLTTELAQYQEKAAAYDALTEENSQLAGMVRLAQSLPGITAPITSSLDASPYGTFEIGAGRSDNVSPGDLVLSSDGFVIGRVTDVDARSALVTELFAPGVATQVSIGGASVEIKGSGGANASAEVPRGIPVAVGDPILAPEFAGRPVGIVGHVASSSASAYSDVIATLPVNLHVLHFVYVAPLH